MTTVPQSWRKSSRSQNTNSCVEVSNTLGEFRDSKNPEGPTLVGDAAALIAAVKGGQLDR
jgi:hypothetical protein